jgi:hypothetical protein
MNARNVGQSGKNKPGKKSKESKPKKKLRSKTKKQLNKSAQRPTASAPEKRTASAAPAGKAGKQLLSAVNNEVGQRSDEIARALVDKTVKGSAGHARLLVELSGASGGKPHRGTPRRGSTAAGAHRSGRGALTAADLPGSEENWEFDIEPEARPGYTPPDKH